MQPEIAGRLLQEIDSILTTIGQSDYEEFRGTMHRASTLLASCAIWAGKIATMSRDDLAALIQEIPEAEQERKFRLLSGLKNSLPKFGDALTKAARMFPAERGGRPESFEDLEAKRKACSGIIALIAGGMDETRAVRRAATELGVSYQTMSRIWQRRTEIAEMSFEEFFTGFLKSLAAGISDSDDSNRKVSQEGSSSAPGVDQRTERMP